MFGSFTSKLPTALALCTQAGGKALAVQQAAAGMWVDDQLSFVSHFSHLPSKIV